MINNSIEVSRWFKDGGDKIIRLNYPLNENSVVLDIGGYTGDFANLIYNKYFCNIYIFEPVDIYYNKLQDRFKNIDKIKIFNYGISGENKKFNLIYDNNCSYFEPANTENIKLKSFLEIYKELNLNNIDLLKLNVEGAEYDILNNIYKNTLMNNIKDIQVQFHYHLLNDPEKTLQEIRSKLSKTHKQTWNYEWVWENWSLK